MSLLKTVALAGMTALMGSPALACVQLDANTGNMYNNCGHKVIVEFKTVGGGCHANSNGTTVIEAGDWNSTSLAMSCSNGTSWQNFWSWCAYDDWVNGLCFPNP